MSTNGDVRRLMHALAAAARRPRSYLRKVVRLALEEQAARRTASLPLVELSDLTGEAGDVAVRIAARDTRHPWSLGAAEQMTLQVLLHTRRCRTAFEIGTFNGGTTRLLAEALPEDGRVWTLDLAPAEFDATQSPKSFVGSQVGVAYRDSPAAHKITQLLGDSLHFDFAPYEQTADIVLVDAGHDYEHGVADTLTALRLVRPGGIVLWDDFEAYWHGLVAGICDTMAERRLGRLAGTAFAVYVAEP